MIYEFTIQPIEWFMRELFFLCYGWTGDYIAALVLLSVASSLVMMPLQRWSGRLVKREQRIQRILAPQLQKIRQGNVGAERHRHEVKLYRRYAYHPVYAFRSVVGALIQLPVLIAAFFMLSDLQELNGVFVFGLFDLGGADGLLGGANLLPLLMTVVNVMAVNTTPGNTSRDCIQGYIIALLFLILLYEAVSALLLFWTFNNLFGLLRNFFFYARQKSKKRQYLFASNTEPLQAEGLKNPISLRGPYGVILQRHLLIIAISWAGYLFLANTWWGEVYSQHIPLYGFPIVITVVGIILSAFRFLSVFDYRNSGSRKDAIILCTALLLFGLIFWMQFVSGARNKINLNDTNLEIGVIYLGVVFIFLAQKYTRKLTGGKFWPNYQTGLPQVTLDRALLLYLGLLATFLLLDLPFLIFINEPSDFFIPFSDLFWPLLLTTLACIGAAWLLIRRCPVSIKEAIFPGAVALTLMALFNGNVRLRDYGLMDNFIFNQPSLLHEELTTTLFELSLLYLFFWLNYRLFRRLGKVVIPLGIGLLLFSAGSSVSNAYRGFTVPVQKVETQHFDLAFSKERTNVLVFLLDGFSGGILPHLLREPKLSEGYRDFTWYRNTLSANGGTWGSLAPMLGGQRFTIESVNAKGNVNIREMFDEAYNTLPDAFLPKDYDVVIYNPYWDPRLRPSPFLQVVSGSAKKYSSIWPNFLGLEMTRLTALLAVFKAAPIAFKESIYLNFPEKGNSVNVDKQVQWKQLSRMGTLPVRVKQKPSFVFTHFLYPHSPMILNSQCQPSTEPSKDASYSPSYITDARCTLLMINRILSRMKEKKVFDNTLIALVSDHGWWVQNPLFPANFGKYVSSFPENRVIPGFAHALLMIKEPGRRQGKMKVSDYFLSNADLPSILCSVVGKCEGVEPDARKGKKRRVLYYNVFRPPSVAPWLNGVGFPSTHLYRRLAVRNNIFNFRNWREVPLK